MGTRVCAWAAKRLQVPGPIAPAPRLGPRRRQKQQTAERPVSRLAFL